MKIPEPEVHKSQTQRHTKIVYIPQNRAERRPRND